MSIGTASGAAREVSGAPPAPSAQLDAREIALADSIERRAWRDLVAAAPHDLARALGLASEELDDATLLVAGRLPLTLFNRVMGLGIRSVPTNETLRAIEARYRAAGVGRYWVHTSPLPTGTEVAARLEAHGFSRPARSRWAKMLRDCAPVPGPDSKLAVRPASPDENARLARVIASAHGMPSVLAPWIEALFARESWRGFGVWDGAEAIAAGMLFVDGETAWLGLAGTLAPARRRGAQGLLLRARIAHAASAGARVVATETGEPIAGEHNPSLRNMERAGFRRVSSRENHERVL